DHYARICEGLRERGVSPVVTFHHFTSPIWLAEKGGWELPETAERFAECSSRAAARLDGLMDRACTINEPNVVAVGGWLMGVYPRGKTGGSEETEAVRRVFVEAHRRSVDAIRAAAPGTPVGLTISMPDYVAVGGGEEAMIEERRLME